MKLKEKIPDKGKVHRKYDTPKTPYQRIMESEQISGKAKKELQSLYQNLNPAELKRNIDKKTHKLYQLYEEKRKGEKAIPFKKQRPPMLRNYTIQQPSIRLGVRRGF